jgi:hypothetical protein
MGRLYGGHPIPADAFIEGAVYDMEKLFKVQFFLVLTELTSYSLLR